jgi:hypothetical protein
MRGTLPTRRDTTAASASRRYGAILGTAPGILAPASAASDWSRACAGPGEDDPEIRQVLPDPG